MDLRAALEPPLDTAGLLELGPELALARELEGSPYHHLDTRAQVISLLVNAAIFFLIFTFIYALIERSRERRMGEARKQQRSGKQATKEGEEGAEASSLKGRPNPNTSRKKTRRRR